MALEDFDEASDDLDLDLGKLDLTSGGGIDPNDPLNEDLFDFPDMGVFASLREASEQLEAKHAEPTTELVEPITEQAAEPADDMDVPFMDNAGKPGSPGYDADLDIDVFDFANVPTDLEPEVDLGTTDEFVVPEAAVPAPAPAPEPTYEPEVPVMEAPAPLPVAEIPVEASMEPVMVSAPAEGGRDKLVMVLAIGFLVLNTGLIGLAWQANSSFHGTLQQVTSGIREGLSNIGSTSSAQETAPKVEYIPIETTGDQPQPVEHRPTELESHPEQSIVVAREMIGAGKFIDARLQLNHLLANQDLLVTLSPQNIAEAEFLIAKTYELQAGALIAEREQ